MKIKGFGLAKKRRAVRAEVQRAAKRWGIIIYRIAIAPDHMHLLIRIPTRTAYRYFIQRLSGSIALKLGVQWLHRPYTRIVEWGRAFKRAAGYIEMNSLEALGFIVSQPRGPGAVRRRMEIVNV